MNTYKERLENLINKTGITPYYLSQATGVSQATISRLRSDETAKPSISTNKKIANYFKVNTDWLLHGKGNMLSDSASQNVNGNNNHVAGRDINISNEDFSKLIDTVNKQQEQMGRLISLLENKLNNNK